jgi:hypothetical protein
MHATTVPAGTLTFAATQSAMLDGEVIEEQRSSAPTSPAPGMHQCFGRFADAMQIPLIAKALLRRPNLARVAGDAGSLVKSRPFRRSGSVTFDR